MTPQQLRNSILQMAIEGKLTRQLPEDGNAADLLKKIKAEKAKLIKEKKIKKEKPLPEIGDDEIPFEVPENWRWVRLNDIYNFIDYRGKTPNKISSGVVLITASNIRKGYLDFSKKDYISVEEYNTRLSRGITQKGDLLFTTEAPIGNVCINTVETVSCGQRVITFQRYDKNSIINCLYNHFILSPFFQSQINENATGTTAKGIKAAILKLLLIPLPPLGEQKRIVSRLEEILPLVDAYEKAYNELQELNKTFPVKLKNSLLQMAIEGKLVEQRPEDGNAADLLKKIKAEKAKLIKEKKIKKEKPLPEIRDDEIPFEVPENWVWTRLGTISSYAQPKVKIKPNDINGSTWSLDLEDIEKNTGHIVSKVYASERNIKGEKVIFSAGNILYSKLRPYLKKILIATDDGVTTSELVPFYVYGTEYQRYFMWYLRSPYVDITINSLCYGIKMPRVGTDTMCKLVIPLPPLAEQKRIVAKLEQLLPLCDELMKHG